MGAKGGGQAEVLADPKAGYKASEKATMKKAAEGRHRTQSSAPTMPARYDSDQNQQFYEPLGIRLRGGLRWRRLPERRDQASLLLEKCQGNPRLDRGDDGYTYFNVRRRMLGQELQEPRQNPPKMRTH